MAPDLPTDWNVFIYTDSAGLPGTQIFSATNIPIVEVGTTFTANLTPAAVLGAGTYWIEIQANMTFGTQGEWGWSDRTVQSNEGAAFRNPGGDFGGGTDWVRKPVCVPTTGGPDQVYRLNGTTGGGGLNADRNARRQLQRLHLRLRHGYVRAGSGRHRP